MTDRRISSFFFILGVFLLLFKCGEKRPLPTGPVDTGPSLAAGDTVYTRVKPDWPVGGTELAYPSDILVNRDGYVFVADRDNNRVLVFNKSGTIIESSDAFGNTGFGNLRQIPDYDEPEQTISPTGIAADARMNIFIVDSSNHVYVWNQYINNVGIDSVATGFTLEDEETGETRTISAEEYWRSNPGEENIVGVTWSATRSRIDSLMKPRMFFTASMPEMLRENYGKSPEASLFNSVAAWRPDNLSNPEREGSIYLTDVSFYNRIIRVDYRKYRLVLLSTGQRLWLHRGKFHSFTATRGTGAGTVNNPTGVYFNYFEQDPKLYFSQIGENFEAHRISLTTGQFDLSETSDMMELGRLIGVRDITSDEEGHIFVANTGRNVIEEFNPRGKFVRYVGTREVIVDTTLTDTVITAGDTSYVPYDTTYAEQVPDVLNNPDAVAASDGVIYVADAGNRRIIRFKLSTDVRIDIKPEE